MLGIELRSGRKLIRTLTGESLTEEAMMWAMLEAAEQGNDITSISLVNCDERHIDNGND